MEIPCLFRHTNPSKCILGTIWLRSADHPILLNDPNCKYHKSIPICADLYNAIMSAMPTDGYKFIRQWPPQFLPDSGYKNFQILKVNDRILVKSFIHGRSVDFVLKTKK